MKTGALFIGLTCIMAQYAPAQQADKVEQYCGMLLKRPENSVLFGRLVDAWLENGEMAGLKGLLEKKAAEGGAMDWRLLAVFRNFSGDEAGALVALDEAMKKTPDDAQTRLARAKALGAATRFDDALADLTVVAKDAALAMEAGTLRGKFLARAGRPAEAVKAWQEIIAAHPGDDGLREDLIELEIGEGMLEEAVAAARELAEKTADPYQKALRRMRVAEILAQAGKKDEAIAGYREVFAVSAESSWLEREVLARVNALFSREDDTAGLRGFYDQLRDAYPRRVAVKKEAARSLMTSGEGDEAVAMFREVLKVLPGDREVRDEFIALLEGAGRNKDAADEITALLATADKDAALWEKLATIRKAMGDQAAADTALDKAIALVPEGEPGRIAAAALYERFGRADDAERILREAVKTHGSDGEAGDALAVLLASRGKADEAVALWRTMAEKADREGLLRIARSLTASGRAADAYAILASRIGAFEGDPLLLAALCQAAQFSEKSEEAIPQAMELVRQAKTTGDLENALRQAVAIVSRAKEPRKWLDELAAKPNPTTQELCLLAEMHETLGDSIEAEKVLQKALASGDALLAAAQRVRLLELRGDLPAAILATRDWLALPGGLKTEQVKRLVGLLERSGETDAALKEIDNWKRIAPGDKLAWSKRAELLQADGRATEAVAELRRALAKFGNEEEVRASLAESLKQAGLFDEAWRMIHALYDEAESPQAKLKWAGSLAEMAATEGKEEEIINDFKRRARENPSSVVPMLALAEMYRQWQRPDEELQITAEASRRKPDDDALLQRLADLEEQSGSKEKAEAVLKSAIRLRDTPDNRRRLSAFWFRNGEVERGLSELLSSKAATNPRDVETLVTPLVTAKDWDNALKVLSSEVPRHPDDWRLGFLHALILREAGKKDEAFAKFSVLLGAKGDLPGVQPLIPAQQMQWMDQNEDAGSFIGLFYHFRQITERDESRRNYYYQGMSQTGLPLPGALLELQWMSLCNAISIANENPETREAKLAGLNGSGIPGLDFIKSVQALKPAELRERVLAEDADPQLFRWYLAHRDRQNNGRGDSNPDAELFRKTADRFVKTDPELALVLLSQLPTVGKDGIGPEGARTMFDLLAGLDAEKRGNMIHMLHGIAFAEEKDVPQDIRKKAEALLLSDIKTAKDNIRSEWVSSQLGMDLLRQGRAEEAANWLNELYKQSMDPALKAKRSQLNPYAMYGHSNSPSWMSGSDGVSLSFPDVLESKIDYQWRSEFQENKRSEKVPADEKKLLDLLGEKNGNHPNEQQRKNLIPADVVIAIIPKLTDPYLRVFLAHHSGKPALLEQEIATLEKNHAGDAAVFQILAAYFTTIKKDTAKAYALLSSASLLPRTNELRDEIDWNLYQAGLALSDKPPAGLDLDPAKRAALRLRKKVSADEDAKTRLAQGLVKLGLEEESRRYTAAPAAFARGNSSNPFYGMRHRSSGGNDLSKTLAKLMADGKRETAARKLLTEIRRLKSTSNAINNPGYSNYELNQAQELITSLKLQDEMMKISVPPDGAGYNSRRDYAMLLASMKKNDLALPLLRTLAAEKKDDMEVSASLLMAMPKEEQKTFVMTLSDGKFDADRIGTWFNSILEKDDKYEALMANAGLLVLFLEKLPPSFEVDRNLSWVNYTAKDLFRESEPNDAKLRPLLVAGNPSVKIDQERTKARDALVLRLYRAMLSHPQTSEQGFILIHAASTGLAIPEAELDAAALAAFSLGARMKEDPEMAMRYGGNAAQLRWLMRTQSGGSRSSGEPGGGLDPMAYLLSRSAQVKNLDPFTPEFLAELTKSDPDKARMLEDCVRITSAQGVSAFQKWKDAPPAEPATAKAQFLSLTRLAALKNRADILDAVLDFACSKTPVEDQRNPYGNVLGNQDVQHLLVSSAKDLPARTRIIDRITRHLLGPPEAWELYGKLDENRSVYALQMRRQLYQYFCQGLSGNIDTSVALARFVAEHRLGKMADIDLRSNLGQGARNADPAVTAKSWLASGIFAPGPALIGSSDDDGKTLIESLEGASDYMNDDAEKKLGEILLKTEGDNRFWARVFGAVFTAKPDVAIAEINSNAATITKWPESDRSAFARWVIMKFPTAEKSAADPIKRLLAQSRKTGNSEMLKLAETYLKDGFPEDFQPYSLDEKLGGMMRSLLTDNPELASKLWLKLQENFHNKSSGYNSSSNGFNKTAVQYVNSDLLDVLDDGNFPISGLAVFMHQMEKAKPGSTFGFFEFGNSYYFDQIFDKYRSRSKATLEADKSLASLKPNLRSFAGTFMSLGNDTPPEARPMLAALFLEDALYSSPSIDSESKGQLRKWSRETLVKLDPALAHAAFIMLAPSSSNEIQDPLKANLRDSFRAILANAEIPAGLRVHILSMITQRSNPPIWNIDPEWHATVAGLLPICAENPACWQSSQITALFLKFAEHSSVKPEAAAKLLAAIKANMPEISRSDPDDARETISRILIMLAIRSGNAEELDKQIKGSADVHRGVISMIFQLWKSGQNAAAVSLLARPGEHHQGMQAVLKAVSVGGTTLMVFSNETETAMPGWLASIPDAGQRFRMECLISSWPDGWKERAPKINRAARIAALVKRFATEAPKPRVSRNECLALLSREPESAIPLAAEYKESVGKQTLLGLVPLREGSESSPEVNTTYVTQALIFMTIQAMMVTDGNADYAISQLTLFDPMTMGDLKDETFNMLFVVSPWFSEIMLARMAELPPEKRKVFGPQALEIFKHLYLHHEKRGKYTWKVFGLASQALVGDGAAASRMAETLPEWHKNNYRTLEQSLLDNELTRLFKSASFKGETNRARRMALLEAVLTDAEASRVLIPHITRLPYLISNQALTKEELISAIDAIPETQPHRAEYLCGKAEIISWKNGTPEETLAAFDAAQAAAGTDAKMLDFIKAYRVMHIDRRMKKPEDALEIAKTIQLDQLPEKERKSIEAILKRGQGKKDKP
jgi:tetratricopeptide (TPR) repeat protein